MRKVSSTHAQFRQGFIQNYADTDQTTYQDIVRPINEKEAEEIARAYGYKIGGKGYSFGGNYGTKGLYLYMTHKILDCILFWCTHGTHLIGVLHIRSI